MTASSDAPRFSVCIPAYNRPHHLGPLLDSILSQDYDSYEIVICEDHSRQRPEIRAVAEAYQARFPGRIRYFENAENLGYDGNFRELIARSTGEYCFIMGNDDLVCPGALRTVSDVIDRHGEVAVVLRSFAAFVGTPENVIQVSRYFPDELVVPAGPDAVVAFFRRLVAMSGIVLNRAEAARHATDRFDGTLFYQQHVAAHALLRLPGVFVPEVLVLFRKDGVPEFGTSARERGKFTPGVQPPDTDLRMIRGLLDIAAHVDAVHGVHVRDRILLDFARFSYPTLAHQAHEPLGVFVRFYRDLARLGFWRSPLFHLYFAGIVTIGAGRMERIVQTIRRRLSYTPALGGRPRGRSVARA